MKKISHGLQKRRPWENSVFSKVFYLVVVIQKQDPWIIGNEN